MMRLWKNDFDAVVTMFPSLRVHMIGVQRELKEQYKVRVCVWGDGIDRCHIHASSNNPAHAERRRENPLIPPPVSAVSARPTRRAPSSSKKRSPTAASAA